MNKKQRALECKLLTQARSGFKAQALKSYNGKPDFNKFELFVYNFDDYCSDTKLSTQGKVTTWYMSNVAPNINSYDMIAIYQGIFDCCFPLDFKENMHRKYMKKYQGETSVQDYFAELELMHQRLKILDTQHVHGAYDVANKYIKGEWAIMGILPDDTNIDELRTTALDVDRAHKICKSIEGQDNHRRCDWSRSRDRRQDKCHDQKRQDRGNRCDDWKDCSNNSK
ncbi:hypothetical protein FRC12_013826 [Ceratobasidium sp. 428]|nr:hypothetical protein FRC12_013826 [Ceratobasidium sp. 428]